VPCKGTPVDTTPGTHTFRVDSVDSSRNEASASTTYSVRYDFDGFYSPLVAEPSSVTLRAGDSVPVKFSLHGDRGLEAVARTAWRPCGDRQRLVDGIRLAGVQRRPGSLHVHLAERQELGRLLQGVPADAPGRNDARRVRSFR
jgi:hypothetical protein